MFRIGVLMIMGALVGCEFFISEPTKVATSIVGRIA
jgi:hypothetical protein